MRLNSKPEEKEKTPKAKEAANSNLPDYPNPETYQSWKISVKKMVRAASDEAFRWVQEVYFKDASLSSLHDIGKFLTLDTNYKWLVALTRVAKRESSGQVRSHFWPSCKGKTGILDVPPTFQNE